MHVRITTADGATDIDAGVALLRDQIVPQLEQQKGFRGLSLSANRDTGQVSVLTLWETEGDLHASESATEKLRGDTLKVLGAGAPTIEHFEEVVSEVGSVPPGPGSRLQVRRITVAPDRIEENLAFFRANVLPEITSTPGFQAVRQLINRDTGEGAVGTVWADESSLQAADKQSEGRRSAAAERGVNFGDVDTREILYMTMR
jgi:heme-degrading monooxygenase HmoA